MAKGGFPGGMGGMGGGNMQQLMLRAQKMQQDVQKAQAELNEREFSASSGGGMVTVTVTGNKDVRSIVINPACVDPDDVEMLQDLVLSAVNEALRTATKTVEDEIGRITGGMGLGL
jgi:DNA-binding YbaB/EbfC family protein